MYSYPDDILFLLLNFLRNLKRSTPVGCVSVGNNYLKIERTVNSQQLQTAMVTKTLQYTIPCSTDYLFGFRS